MEYHKVTKLDNVGDDFFHNEASSTSPNYKGKIIEITKLLTDESYRFQIPFNYIDAYGYKIQFRDFTDNFIVYLVEETMLEKILKENDKYCDIYGSESMLGDVLKAMKEYAKYCCEQQKKICLNKAKIDWFEIVENITSQGEQLREEHIETKSVIAPDYSNDIFRINEESILNSPTFEEL